MPSSDITGDDSDKESIIVQGAVDCAFEENGSIIIIDYKTDNIDDMSQLNDRYNKQLKLYKAAMEKCTGKCVNELLIYSFKLNDCTAVK